MLVEDGCDEENIRSTMASVASRGNADANGGPKEVLVQLARGRLASTPHQEGARLRAVAAQAAAGCKEAVAEKIES